MSAEVEFSWNFGICSLCYRKHSVRCRSLSSKIGSFSHSAILLMSRAEAVRDIIVWCLWSWVGMWMFWWPQNDLGGQGSSHTVDLLDSWVNCVKVSEPLELSRLCCGFEQQLLLRDYILPGVAVGFHRSKRMSQWPTPNWNFFRSLWRCEHSKCCLLSVRVSVCGLRCVLCRRREWSWMLCFCPSWTRGIYADDLTHCFVFLCT